MYLGRYRRGEWVDLAGLKVNPGVGEGTFPYPQFDTLEDERIRITVSGSNPRTKVVDEGFVQRFKGLNNPFVHVYDKDLTKVAEKEMWPRAPDYQPAIFTASLFLGSDIPVGICTAVVVYRNLAPEGEQMRSPYPDGENSWARLPQDGRMHGHSAVPIDYEYTTRLREMGMVCSFEVLPGHEAGSYLDMHTFNPEHAQYVLGHHDNGTLDFRKNPKE